jgi:PAS domain S-box-containing protein
MTPDRPRPTFPAVSGLTIAAVGLLALLLAVLWSGLFYHLASQRQSVLERAAEDTENLTRVYATQVHSMLSSVDQTLQLLKRLHAAHDTQLDPSVALADSFLLNGADVRVSIAGPDGTILFGAGYSNNVADQGFFREHREHPSDGMFIAPPQHVGPQDDLIITMSRRIDHPDGSFGGVVALSFNPLALRATLAATAGSRRVVSGVVGLDRVIRFASGTLPRVFGQIGEPLNAPQLFAIRAARPDGVDVPKSVVDGVTRVVAWRTLDDYPMFVVSAREQDEVLENYQRNRTALIGATAAISGIFAVAFGLLLQVLRQRDTVMTSLRDSRAQLLEAQQLGKIGHWVADVRRGRITFSDECFKMMGWEPAPEVPVEHALAVIHPDDIERYLAVREGDGGDVEVRFTRSDGSLRWCHMRIRVGRDAAGRAVSRFGTVQDITERKLAEEAVWASEERYQLLVDGSREGMFDHDVPAGIIWFSERTHQLLGLPNGALNGNRRNFLARVHPDDRVAWDAELARLMAAREPYSQGVLRVRHADGTWRWISTGGRIVYAADGTPLRAVGSFVDVTTAKTAEAALLESNRRLLETERLGRVGSVVWDAATDRVSWSDSLFELMGLPKQEFVAHADSLATLHPEDRDLYMAARAQAIAERRDFTCECRLARPDGTIRWVHIIGHPRIDEAGVLVNLHLVVRDNTEIREAELALRRSEERYALAIAGMREGLFDRDVKSNTIWFSPHVHEILGLADGALNGDRSVFIALIHPDDQRRHEGLVARLAKERRAFASASYRARHADGTWRWIAYHASMVYDEAGALIRTVGSIGDITEQKLAEEALREREQQLRAIMDNARVAIFLKDRERRFLLVNRQYAAWRGLEPAAMIGRTDAELSPEIEAAIIGTDEAVLEQGRTSHAEYTPAIHYPGLERIEVMKFPITGADQSIVGLAGFIFDVTERRRAEEHLRQSAKMEAIGRVASGIAHDFNNMIGAITGFSSFLLEDLAPGSPQHRFAGRIAQVCNHAKEVVKQVTAFSVQGDVETQRIDLREAVAKDESLVRASLAPTTRLVVELGAQPLPLIANEGQIHQVLLNLCLNANDALDGRAGTITVRLERLEPRHPERRRFSAGARKSGSAATTGGRLDPARAYAAIRVADTGNGMDQATLEHVFEPFYTTKGPGRGTGLGLAVIHGIVNLYAGAYRVTSQVGRGSEFTIYLPLAAESGDARSAERVIGPLDGTERVLLVDDDPDMTEPMTIGLTRLGYGVTSKLDPLEALRIFEDDPDAWDAVVTDHSMPGMLGAELAERIKALRPDCPVVLYTGGPERAATGDRTGRGADVVLLKPIEPRRVAEQIRRLLDGFRVALARRDQQRPSQER